MKQISYKCYCIECRKESSSLGIVTHFMRSHGSTEDKLKWKNSNSAVKAKKHHNEQLYMLSPKLCQECNESIPYGKGNVFCCHSCAATHSNRKRTNSGWCPSIEQRVKVSKKLKYPSTPDVVGPYSVLYNCTCKHCSYHWRNKKPTQFCSNCEHLKWKNNKDQWSFKFNVFDYPDLFDIDNLTKLGWVQFGGKNRKKPKNLNGLSRDHMVSVDYAKKNKCDPYYISHPCNCEIMPHSKNNSKKTKSSISYEELIIIVNTYDQKWADCSGNDPVLPVSQTGVVTSPLSAA